MLEIHREPVLLDRADAGSLSTMTCEKLGVVHGE
jgi:hypothetical protein